MAQQPRLGRGVRSGWQARRREGRAGRHLRHLAGERRAVLAHGGAAGGEAAGRAACPRFLAPQPGRARDRARGRVAGGGLPRRGVASGWTSGRAGGAALAARRDDVWRRLRRRPRRRRAAVVRAGRRVARAAAGGVQRRRPPPLLLQLAGWLVAQERRRARRIAEAAQLALAPPIPLALAEPLLRPWAGRAAPPPPRRPRRGGWLPLRGGDAAHADRPRARVPLHADRAAVVRAARLQKGGAGRALAGARPAKPRRLSRDIAAGRLQLQVSGSADRIYSYGS
mmetsp:Transcript_5746/g.18807  ORF Transcript_5746/g.18807 Transcript_5746/m.18807 type:complete len:282 (+) Transcript_5746:873-1718(+)